MSEPTPRAATSGLDAADVERWRRLDAAGFLRERPAEPGSRAPHVEVLGYRLEEVEVGSVVLSWQVPDHLLNPAGIAHGGFLVALLDDAAGLAAASRYPRFVPQLTVQLHTDFLKPVLPGITHRVEGTLVRGGRSSNLADARILSPDGELLTRSTGVFQPNRRLIPRELWEEAGL